VFPQQPQQSAHHDEREDRQDHQAEDHAEFLARDGEDEVGMGVGQNVLDPSLAGAAPQQAAVAERLHRRVDLVVVAGAIEEFIDASVHVVGPAICQHPAAASQPDSHRDEDQVQAADIKLDQEHGGDHRHHADIRLFQQ